MKDIDLSDVVCSCGKRLTVGRVKYSGSNKCVSCSDTRKKSAIRIISGKTTYSELQFVDEETARKFNRAEYRQGQSPGNGMKGTSKLR